MNAHVKPPERQVISAVEVAALLGYRCRESFQNKRTLLEGKGFPRKVPGLNGWSKPAILRWLEANGEVQEAGEAVLPPRRSSPLERRFAS